MKSSIYSVHKGSPAMAQKQGDSPKFIEGGITVNSNFHLKSPRLSPKRKLQIVDNRNYSPTHDERPKVYSPVESDG